MAQLRTTKRILRLRSAIALGVLLAALFAALLVLWAGRATDEAHQRELAAVERFLVSISEVKIALDLLEDAETPAQIQVLQDQVNQAVGKAGDAYAQVSADFTFDSEPSAIKTSSEIVDFEALSAFSDFLAVARQTFGDNENSEVRNDAALLAAEVSSLLMPIFDLLREAELQTDKARQNRQIGFGIAATVILLSGVLIATVFAHLPMERYVLNAQLDIERSQRAAEVASEAKTMFLATMSHEIRTPLNGVLGLADVLSDTQLDAEQKRMLGMISSSGNHLLQMINDILDLAKFESGKTALEFVDFDLDALCRETAELFSGQALRKEVRLVVETTSSEMGWYLHSAPGAVRQILSNLVGNAVKFTEAGEVTVCLEDILGPEGAPRFVKLTVKDTGIGMSPESLKRVFGQFEQADASTTTRFGGTGLGLAIVKQLSETMNGTIQVSSTLNEGSVFSFIFPVAKALARKKQPRPMLARSFNKRILVADDNKVNQMVAQKLLQSLGCEVCGVANGIEAVEKAKSWVPDLILMDVRMPHMDGLEATRTIRNDATIPNSSVLPIVGLSANAPGEHEDEISSMGMSGYLQKPINRTSLVMELMRHWPVAPEGDVDLGEDFEALSA